MLALRVLVEECIYNWVINKCFCSPSHVFSIKHTNNPDIPKWILENRSSNKQIREEISLHETGVHAELSDGATYRSSFIWLYLNLSGSAYGDALYKCVLV